MALIKLNCESCGGELQKTNNNEYKCNYCSSQYVLKNDENLGLILELLTEKSFNSSEVSVLEAKKRIFEENAKTFKGFIKQAQENIEFWDEKLKENSTKITVKINIMCFMVTIPLCIALPMCIHEESRGFGILFSLIIIIVCSLDYSEAKKKIEKEKTEYNNNKKENLEVLSESESGLKESNENINYLKQKIMEM